MRVAEGSDELPSHMKIARRCEQRSRGAMENKWEGWSQAGVLIEIPKFLGDLTWQALCERRP